MGELILLIIFVLYLILGLKTPELAADMIDSLAGKITIFVLVIYMFLNMHPIVATFSLFVAFQLMYKSYVSTDEPYKFTDTSFNNSPYTLEQEMVNKMAPRVNSGVSLHRPTYKPTLDNLYDASTIN